MKAFKRPAEVMEAHFQDKFYLTQMNYPLEIHSIAAI
jgi:hypothetical protein